ncbi:uncharacterized protein LOC135388513 isoform X2 [Ornithodoros turicata]|uniref:uncharacterized protein LOC135388513 isoform X2 n=1 Tax=Ornithodoros turicata TaxID=34597 RepID=UPI0031394782
MCRTTLLVTALLMACLRTTMSSRNNLSLSADKTQEGVGCEWATFEQRRKVCEQTFSGGNAPVKVTCSDGQEYVACVNTAMRQSRCITNSSVRESEYERIMGNMRRRNLTCAFSQAPEIMRQDLGCQKSVAVKKLFACSAVFRSRMMSQVSADSGKNTICRLVNNYKECVHSGLKHTNCIGDKHFSDDLLYFMGNEVASYATMCRLVGAQEMRLQKAFSRGDKLCNQATATETYLTCGKQFLDSVPVHVLHAQPQQGSELSEQSRMAAPSGAGEVNIKQEHEDMGICMGLRTWLACYHEGFTKSNCKEGTELHRRSKVIHKALVAEFGCSDVRPPTEMEEQSLCQERRMLNDFFICAMNYHVSRKLIENEANPDALCQTTGKLEKCVTKSMKNTGCLHEESRIMHHLKYITDLITEPSSACTQGQATLSQQSFLSNDTKCWKNDLFKRYFECGFTFQKGLEFDDIPSFRSDGDRRCMMVADYNACYHKAVGEAGCLSKSSLTDTMEYIMELGTKDAGYKCLKQPVTYNSGLINVKCAKSVAVKNVFLCAITFEQIVDDLRAKRQDSAENMCKYLEEMSTCVTVVKRSTGCDRDSEIFHHVTPVLHSLTHDYEKRCTNNSSPFRMSFVQLKSPVECIRQHVLKKMFVCGLTYSNLVDEIEPRVESRSQVKCKLLLDYKSCIQNVSGGTGCEEDPEVRAQIMSFMDMMRDEYRSSCMDDALQWDSQQSPLFRELQDDQSSTSASKESPFQKGAVPGLKSVQAGNRNNVDIDVDTFLDHAAMDGTQVANPNRKRGVQIAKEYLDDSSVGLSSYASGLDYKDDDDVLPRSLNKRNKLRENILSRRGDPSLWVNSRRAIKILDDEEQGDDRRTRGRDSGKFSLGERLRAKKAQDYEDDDYDILSDKEMRVSGEECQMKRLRKQSQICDKTFSQNIQSVTGRNSARLLESVPPAKEIQGKLCLSLKAYRSCLLETANRLNCGEIAGKVSVVVEDQMKKLGMAFCTGCRPQFRNFFQLAVAAVLFQYILT